MKFKWKVFSVLHRLFDIVIHFIFKIANFGEPEKPPPIKNYLLMAPAVELAAMIRKKKLKSVDLVQAYISRAQEVNPSVNAAVHFRSEAALKEAMEVDASIASNARTEAEMEADTPFLGVPLSVKEMIAIEGLPLSAGLVSRRDTLSQSDAQVVKLMRSAGAIPFATTNTSELGMWYESHNRLYGRTSNPYDTHRTPGGSTGGEASLISAGGSVMGIGSDIGGSIRMPAFFCGIFGHKPTPEVVSNFGTYPPSSEREFVPYLSIGPLCRFAKDLLPMMKVMAGKNASLLRLELPVKMTEIKIYYVEDVGNHVMFTKVEKDMIDALHKAVHHFANAYRATPQKLSPPGLRLMYPMWASAISSCRAPPFSAELTQRKGTVHFRRELLRWMVGQSPHTLPAIILGLTEKTVIEHGDRYLSLLQDLRRHLVEVLGDDGVLLFPSHPTVAPHHNEAVFKPLNFAYTGIFNVLGFPVTQCPLGIGREGLPLGVQVAAGPYNDRLTLAVAAELEKAFGGWHPPIEVLLE